MFPVTHKSGYAKSFMNIAHVTVNIYNAKHLCAVDFT